MNVERTFKKLKAEFDWRQTLQPEPEPEPEPEPNPYHSHRTHTRSTHAHARTNIHTHTHKHTHKHTHTHTHTRMNTRMNTHILNTPVDSLRSRPCRAFWCCSIANTCVCMCVNIYSCMYHMYLEGIYWIFRECCSTEKTHIYVCMYECVHVCMHIPTFCNPLQHAATCCNVLQHAATHMFTSRGRASRRRRPSSGADIDGRRRRRGRRRQDVTVMFICVTWPIQMCDITH